GYAAQAIIWVIVGGRGTLIGPVLAAFGIYWLTGWLGTQAWLSTNVVLGLVLILFVLLLPRGVVPAVMDLAGRRRKPSLARQARAAGRRRRVVAPPAQAPAQPAAE
ncbi:MAG: branched-chain amino acid ABC transporter permease, partial [Pseudomonadota bacterium]